jgi:hypothetical protein
MVVILARSTLRGVFEWYHQASAAAERFGQRRAATRFSLNRFAVNPERAIGIGGLKPPGQGFEVGPLVAA